MGKKESLWSMSTTIREAERILGFLETAKEIEGEEWYSGSPSQKKFQVLLVKNRQYLNDPENTQAHNKLDEEQCKALDDKSIDMTYEMAESIIEAKNYEGGPEMRGRQSMSPLVKLGLVYYEQSAGRKFVRISDVGNRLISGELSFGDFMLDSLLKYQYPNPSEAGFVTWNTKPFINTLRLIKEVNSLCEERGIKSKGISSVEFGIFVLSLRSYKHVRQTAMDLLDFRHEFENTMDDEKDAFKDAFINEYLKDFNNPVKNCREYTDNMVRYLRLTKLIYIRGKYDHTYIDLEPRRLLEINAILEADNGSAKQFTQDEWNKYIGTYGTYVLPYETIPALTAIAEEVLKENEALSAELHLTFAKPAIPTGVFELKAFIQDQREYRTHLQNLKIKHDVHKDTELISQTIAALTHIVEHNKAALAKKYSIELEKWTNVALNILNDAQLIKPNAPVGDDNEPTYTAASGVPDIECYYDKFVSICEVTMLCSRDQWYNEGQPVMRHLRDFEQANATKPAYCLFIAPKLHIDTVNTFYTSVKYEYDGANQKIIPITIGQLKVILQTMKSLIEANKMLSHLDLQSLYESCSNMSEVKNSSDWLEKIDSVIHTWSDQLLAA